MSCQNLYFHFGLRYILIGGGVCESTYVGHIRPYWFDNNRFCNNSRRTFALHANSRRSCWFRSLVCHRKFMVGWGSIFDHCGFIGAEEVVKAENVVCFGERG
jgi:hypothetical protein